MDVNRIGFEHPTFSGRLGFRPNPAWNLGVSASSGTYLLPQAGGSLPRGNDIGDYREFVLGQDVSFAWHKWQLWAEIFETRFQVPTLGNADTLAYYIEAKYKVTPQLFAAARWNQQFQGTVRNGEDGRQQWGYDLARIDSAVGYRFTNYLQLKLQYSYSPHDAALQDGEHLGAVQFTVKF